MACIYALKNRLMVGFCKIGISENVEKRVKELYGGWVVVKTWEMDIEKARYHEAQVKKTMSAFAVHGFELFNCPVGYLIRVINESLTQEVRTELPPESITIKATVEDIGKLIRTVRNKKGLSLRQLSSLYNFGYRFAGELERGKESCHMGKALKVLNAVGIELYIHVPSESMQDRE
jgi:hypothetical protein